ncbi:MAG: SDR family oxidoreductase [Candidatus Omnitrophica bacterium]|nr:SDR family oxidoreductase [Candidatus Omnitrophota bacterium]
MSANRIALVTGANKGLGFETSRQLALKGIKIFMGARDIDKGKSASKKLKDQGLDVECIELDVTNSSHIKQAGEYFEKHYGRLDILVNNAGMTHAEEPFFGNSAGTVSAAAVRKIFEVNLFGQVELTQKLLPLLKKSDAGRIVNVSSILGSLMLQSNEKSDLAQLKPFAYDASKAALNQFTIHLAALLKDTPIKVNSAHPGWVKTDLGTDMAPMVVEEGAKTAVRLATLNQDGPTGKFFHFNDEIPW